MYTLFSGVVDDELTMIVSSHNLRITPLNSCHILSDVTSTQIIQAVRYKVIYTILVGIHSLQNCSIFALGSGRCRHF